VKHVNLGKYQILLRIVVILLAAISPFICLLYYGYLPSLSGYWDTNLQPLFIIANAATSYYLYSIKDWKISAFMLLLLTSFSLTLFPQVHNILAICFFIVNVYPLVKTNHFKWCIWPYLASLSVLPWSMTIAEIIAIDTLCVYHMLVLLKAASISNSQNHNA